MKKKILIVEDNIDIIHTLGLGLELQGYEPIRAMDGNQAIIMASLHLPDLILLDLILPDMDGLQVARLIRQNKRTQSIPILAMSGIQSFKVKQECVQNGFDDYISKPFSVNQLCSHIRDLLI